MSKIIAIHSFRGGTGKSNTTANVAAILASQGRRVGIIDTDIQSPGIHVLFGLDESIMKHALNDFLWGDCDIKDAACDVTERLDTTVDGRLYLIPSSTKAGEIARVLREGYDVGLLNDGFHELIDALDLEVLMIDTHPGLNDETLLSVAIADLLGVIMRPDEQDYQGTSVTVEVARKLNVPELLIIVNKTPPVYDFAQVKSHVEARYSAEVAAVMPHSDEMMVLASAGVFVLQYPNHEMTRLYEQIAKRLVAN